MMEEFDLVQIKGKKNRRREKSSSRGACGKFGGQLAGLARVNQQSFKAIEIANSVPAAEERTAVSEMRKSASAACSCVFRRQSECKPVISHCLCRQMPLSSGSLAAARKVGNRRPGLGRRCTQSNHHRSFPMIVVAQICGQALAMIWINVRCGVSPGRSLASSLCAAC
jgi:hypothetical protein